MNMSRSHAVALRPAYPSLFQRTTLVSAVFLACISLAHGETETADTQSLSTLTVTSERIQSALAPTEGYMAETSTVGTKTDTPLIETPQSISVVTRDQIEDQGSQTVQQALRYTAGAFTGARGGSNRYDFVTLRGFGGTSGINNIYLDGLKLLGDTQSYNSLRVAPYFLERIDVIKGPASVLYGQNQPGGLVALTTKHPLFQPYHEVELEEGTNGQRGARFDFSGPLNSEQTVAYRLVGQADGSDTQYVHTKERSYTIAPSITLAPDEDTILTLSAYLQHEPYGGFYDGLPVEGTIHAHNGHHISRHFTDSETDFDGFDRYQRMFGYQLEHRFNDTFIARQNFRYISSDVDYDQIYNSAGFLSDTSNELSRGYAQSNESLKAYTVDNQLQANFDTGPFEHTVLTGLDYQHRKNNVHWTFGGVSSLSAFDPNYGDYTLGPLYTDSRFRDNLTQTGIYLQDQIKYEHWRLNLAGRQDWSNASVDNIENLQGTGGTTSRDNSESFTTRAALLYAFDNGVSPYVSYAEGFNPNTAQDINGNVLKPTESEQYELGVKYQPLGSQSYVSASVFRLTQSNVAVRDTSDLSQFVYASAGKIRTHGFELEGRAQLTDQLALLGSYTYTDMSYVEYIDPNTGDNLSGNTPYQAPRHMASVWGKYNFFDGLPNGLGLGVGVRYVGTSWANETNTDQVPAYTLVDAMIDYDLGKLSSNLDGMDVRVNANNLFDKNYISSCAGTNFCFYGEERNVTATVSYNW